MKDYIIYLRKKRKHLILIKGKKKDKIFFLNRKKNLASLHLNLKFKRSFTNL